MLVTQLPDVSDPLTSPFWKATLSSRLVVQQCASCGYLRWPPGPVCPQCLSIAAAWTEIRPAGLLWSYATYHRSFDPALAADVPYSVGLIELDDGPRMYGRLLGDPDQLAVGGRVRAVYEAVSPDVRLVSWQLEEGIE
jgi:uncharacterized protein